MWDTQLVIPESLGAAILNDKGYIIEAEKPIYVSVRLQSQAQAGAIVSKGGAALSDSFLFGGFVNFNPIQRPSPVGGLGEWMARGRTGAEAGG